MPIAPSLVADQYPLGVRTRVFAIEALGRPLGQVLGPLFAGAVVVVAGDDAGDWRVVFWRFLFLRGSPFYGRYRSKNRVAVNKNKSRF